MLFILAFTTILVERYDFTSLVGIKEAYNAAFTKSVTIKKALDNAQLKELSAKRNVIAHRAKVIDGEYCHSMGINEEEIGQKLEVTNEDITRLGDSVVVIGIELIQAVNSYLEIGKMPDKKDHDTIS